MDNNKKIQKIKMERVFHKFIALLNKGYDINYCKTRFAKYTGIIDEYAETIERLKKLKRNDLGDSFLKNTLSRIYSEENNKDTKLLSGRSNQCRTRYLLKPATIFLSVFVFFIFSFAGVAHASQNSIPGNILYPVKRYVESAELFIYPDSAKNAMHFQLLNNRLDEAVKVINSDINTSKKTDELLKDIDEEFNQLKKGNYYGNKSEKEIKDMVDKIKEKYKEKVKKEKEKNENTENNNSNNKGGNKDKNVE